jgi:hypothetical protein
MSQRVSINYEFPNYPLEIVLSEKRRKSYFKEEDKLPKVYQDQSQYIWKERKSGKKTETVLYDRLNKEFVVKNSKTVDTPRTLAINGQRLHDLTLLPAHRHKIITLLKNYFITLMVKQNKANSVTRQYLQALHKSRVTPIGIVLEFFNSDVYDLDNHELFYKKTLFDCFQNYITTSEEKLDNPAGFIPDDNVKNINRFLVHHYETLEDGIRRLRVTINFDIDNDRLQSIMENQ